MTNLERAIKDGYAHIIGEKGKEKITYVSSDNHVENYSDPEEKVRAEFWAELIYKYEYPVNRIKIEVTVPDRLPTDRADIVVFRDDECKRPYAVVECKKDGVTDAEFNQAIEQGVGNATWVKLRADYVVIIAGGTRRVLDVTDKFGALEREQNILADLPHAYGKPQEFRFYKGSENDIKPVDREDLIAAIKKCHQTLWGGGRLSPPTAFGELCKLIFVKISDEQKPRKKGEPYQFQIKTHEPASKLAERINALYDEQKKKDPEVFTDSIKVDDRVLRTVVSHLEAINLHETDLDVKGVAFEQFMDGFFKGDFGQYFTPRPIIEFAVKMTAPEHDWDVLDTSCGSGGFLLYALDYIRHQATEKYCAGKKIDFNEETGYLVKYNAIDNRIDVDHYSPKFIALKEKIESSSYPVVYVEDICLSIKSGFAAGKQDQGDALSDEGLILIHNGTDAEADEHTPSNIKMYEQIRFNQDYHKLETELKAKLIDYYKL